MRALGIDFGERRIGLAISDPDARLAVPYETFERTSDRQAVARIAAVASAEEIGLLVLGEPRGLDGGRGEATERVERFGDKLAQATGLPLERVDEALTSVEAAARLAAAGHSRRGAGSRRGADGRRGRRLRGAVDALAAQILLQEALDRRCDDGAG